MSSLFQKIIIDTIKKRHQKRKERVDAKQIAKEVRTMNVEIIHFLQEVMLIGLGIVAAGFGLGGFLLPNSFIDGGVTGISLLTEEVTGISLSILLVAINLPFLILGYQTIGKKFALKSFIAIACLATVVHFIHYPNVTSDKLLVAIFGGFFLGLGIGLAMRGGAVIDGTEVLAVFLSRKTGMSIGDVILVFNIIIFSFGAYILSVETALYAILTYLAAAKTVDFVIDGIEEYIGVTIISKKNEEIRLAITNQMGRGCTVYQGKRGFAKIGEPLQDTNIIFTVITRLELARLKTEIDKIDEKAFIIMNSIKDTKGGMVKRRPLNNH